VPNTVIRRDLQIPTVKEEIHRYSSQYSVRLSAHPNDLIVNLIELPDNKTPAKWSAYQIPGVIVVFVILVFKHSSTCHCIRFLHNLLNILAQIANKMSAKLVPTFSDRGCRVVSSTDPYSHILDFLDQSRYFSIQIAPQFYSWGWVYSVQDPLLSQNIW
jgi:hypothetical protein